MRRPYQMRILDLLLLTTVVALVCQFWPRKSVSTQEQLQLIGWTTSCVLQLVLFRKAWQNAPNARDKDRYIAFVIAYPACLMPIFMWLFAVVSLILSELGVELRPGDQIGLVIFLVGAWFTSLVAIPASFLTSRHPLKDQTFLWLRIIAMINLTVPLIPAIG